MKRPPFFHGFLIFYFALIAGTYLGNQFLFHENFTISSSGLLVLSIAQSSLTGIIGPVLSQNISAAYIYFSLIITQLGGIGLLTYLLFLYWQLFHPNMPQHSIKAAFLLTIKVTVIVETCLFIFFLYALSGSDTNQSVYNQILPSLMLSIHSFNNAGLPFVESVSQLDSITHSFILQLGIIGGNTMGGLGIFVIDELLNPINLRRRLADPKIDWSPITKLSLFGGAFILLIFSCHFYIHEKGALLGDFQLIDSIIASIYETSSARGFGYSLFNSLQINEIVALFGAGTFTTGGGFTLVIIMPILSFFMKNHLKSMDWEIIAKLAKNLIIYFLISLCVASLIFLLIKNTTDSQYSFSKLMNTLNTNQLSVSHSISGSNSLFLGIVNIIGRLSFVVACIITLKQIRKKHASSTI